MKCGHDFAGAAELMRFARKRGIGVPNWAARRLICDLRGQAEAQRFIQRLRAAARRRRRLAPVVALPDCPVPDYPAGLLDGRKFYAFLRTLDLRPLADSRFDNGRLKKLKKQARVSDRTADSVLTLLGYHLNDLPADCWLAGRASDLLEAA